MDKKELAIEIYTDIIDVLETSRTQLCESNEKFSAEFLYGFESSYETFIEFLYTSIDDLKGNN